MGSFSAGRRPFRESRTASVYLKLNAAQTISATAAGSVMLPSSRASPAASADADRSTRSGNDIK